MCSASALGVAWFLGGPRNALADTPAVTDGGAPKTIPQDSVFSSVKQSLNQDIEHDVVRGHFELGDPPNVRRYYCLISTKTGRREPNGVLGDLDKRPNGMSGVKSSSVSMYSCTKAEQAGLLVTTGYIFNGAPVPAPGAASTPTAPQPPMEVMMKPSPPATGSLAAPPATAATAVALSPNQVDIAGIRLGMSPDEVRAVLKAKKLLDYNESAETLSYLDSAKGAKPITNGRFINVIAAWTPAPTLSAGDNYQVDGEAFEVVFTPVPGKERVMGIVHSMGYSPANAVREVALESGLIKKYGGFGGNDLPQSPTWRIQTNGYLQVGDPCNRRGTLGGIGALNGTSVPRENLALKRSADDFKSVIERCGVAILTEDHFTANGGALREDRLVTRFTMTAYSPQIALEGAKAATQLIQTASGAAKKPEGSRPKDSPEPSL